MVLCLVIVAGAGITRTGTEHSDDAVAVVAHGTQVDKCALLSGHLVADTVVRYVSIVVEAIRAAEDGVHATLQIFNVGRTLQQIVVLAIVIAVQLFLVGLVVANAGLVIKAVLIRAMDGAAKVVTAVNDIHHPRESGLISAAAIGLPADDDLRVAQDVGIAGASESVVDAAVAQVDVRVAADIALVAAAIQIFCLGQVFRRLVIGIDGRCSVEVHGAAESRIEVVFLPDDFTVFVQHITRFADHTLFAAAINLEDVAVVEVHGGVAPYLGVFTVSGTEHRHGYSHQVVTLTFEVDIGLGPADEVDTGAKDLIFLDDVVVDVDDHVAVDMTALVAAAVCVGAQETEIGVVITGPRAHRHESLLIIVRAGSNFCADSRELSCTG